MNRVYQLFLLLLLPLLASAQPKLEGGLFLGIANYTGDLTKTSAPELGESGLSAGIVGRYHLFQMLAVRGDLRYGKISGTDFNYFDRKSRGFTFKTNIVQLSALAEFEPMGRMRYYSGTSRFKKLVSPYLYTGISLAYINPKIDFSKSQIDSFADLAVQDQNADYSKLNFVVPIGVGLKVDIKEFWVINLDLSFQYPFSDYVDGYSIAGNPDANDWYFYGGVMVTKRFRSSNRQKRK